MARSSPDSGFRSKTRRVITQLSPHDFTAFKWEGTASFFHYVTVVLLLAVFLAAELNPFYLKVKKRSHFLIEDISLTLYLEPSVDGAEPSDYYLQISRCLPLCTASCPGAIPVFDESKVWNFNSSYTVR